MTNLDTATRADLEVAILDNDLDETLFSGLDDIMSMDTEEIRKKLINWVIEGNEATCEQWFLKTVIMAKIQLPVRIEQDDLNTLKELAELDNRPLSNYVDTVLKNHIALKKQKSGGKI